MKTLLTTAGKVAALTTALVFGVLVVQPASGATTVLLDANGTAPGFWDGVSAVFCDVNVTNT